MSSSDATDACGSPGRTRRSSAGSEPLSPTLAALKSSAMLSAAKRLEQVKESLGEFHKKGGFVGWLHGDEGEPRATGSAEEREKPATADAGDSFALAYSPSQPNREALDARARLLSARRWPSAPSIRAARDEDDGLRTPPSPRSASASPEKALVAIRGASGSASMPASASASVLESLCDKVAKPRAGSSPRLALQPSPRLKAASRPADVLASGFDDFVAASADASARWPKAISDSPRRAAAPRAPPPLARACSEPIAAQASLGGDAPALTLDDYLADPKLAAEFVRAALPGDDALLALLYAIEDLDALATLPTAAEQAEASARTLLRTIHGLRERDGGAGPRTLAVLARLALPAAEDAEALAPAATLLFRVAHSAIYAELDAALARQLTPRSECVLLAAERQRELQAARRRESALLLLDALLEDEWASAVLWAFLFRASRHQRLSVLMAVRSRLDPLATANRDARQLRRLAAQLAAFASKFLSRDAPVPLPTATLDAARLKAAAVTRIARLSATCSASESDDTLAMRVASAMESVASLEHVVRAELVAAEQLAAFSSSALFQEFAASPSAPRGDFARLFRAARVPFHQTPQQAMRSRDLLAEYVANRQLGAVAADDDRGGRAEHALIYRVLAFERRRGETESGRTTFVDLVKRCEIGDGGAAGVGVDGDAALLRTVEGFLVPETVALDELCVHRRLAFHFVAGAGDDTLYGAAIRVPVRLPLESEGGEDMATQGVCVLSRAPLVDSLRQFVRALWLRLGVSSSAMDVLAPTSERIADVDTGCIRAALAEAQAVFDGFIDSRYSSSPSTQLLRAQEATGCDEDDAGCALPTLDLQLRELFESLSVGHIVRVFGCLVAERKVVLVASSFSLLVAAGEALRALLFPLAWAHVFAPVLPLSLRRYLQCPSPFLFGLHASYVRDCELPSDVVVVDLDVDSVTCPGGADDADAALAGLRDSLLALCRPRAFTRDDIDCDVGESDAAREFPEREVRLAFRQQLASMLAALEAASFRFESSGSGGGGPVVAVVDAPLRDGSHGPKRDEGREGRLKTALRQSQAFSAYVCRSPV